MVESAQALSAGQRGIWFAHQVSAESAEFNIPVAARIRGKLNREALFLALDAVVARHPALRTRFIPDGSSGPIRIAETPRHVEVELCRLATGSPNETDSRVADFAWRRMDIAHGMPLRCLLVEIAEDDHVFVVNVHHIVFDDWSIGVFFRDLGVLYQAADAGTDLDQALPPLADADPDGELAVARDADLTFWRTQLSGLRAMPLSQG